MFVGSSDGNMYSLNAHRGALQWRVATGDALESPAVANGVVYARRRPRPVGRLRPQREGVSRGTDCADGPVRLWDRPVGGLVQLFPDSVWRGVDGRAGDRTGRNDRPTRGGDRKFKMQLISMGVRLIPNEGRAANWEARGRPRGIPSRSRGRSSGRRNAAGPLL